MKKQHSAAIQILVTANGLKGDEDAKSLFPSCHFAVEMVAECCLTERRGKLLKPANR